MTLYDYLNEVSGVPFATYLLRVHKLNYTINVNILKLCPSASGKTKAPVKVNRSFLSTKS